MQIRHLLAGIVVAGLAGLIITQGFGQQSRQSSANLASYQKARRVIDDAVKAMGGEEALRQLHGVRRDLTDDWVDIGQQQHPWIGPIVLDKLPVGERSVIVSYIDYSSGAWLKAQKFDDGPGDQFLQIDGGTNDGGFSKGRFHEEKPVWGTSDANDAAAGRAREIRRLPEGLLRLALERPETLQSLGTVREGERQLNVVSMANSSGAATTVYFDAKTHLPARAEFIRDHPVLGDTWADVVYDDYRRAGALVLPFRYIDRIGGVPTHVMKAESIDTAAPEPVEMFQKPGEFVATLSPPNKPTLNDRGDGVYEILGSYNMMFAVFRDYVLLVETPLNENYMESALEFIRSVAPNKPIRAVPSHFHFDHIGGVRALAARGVPLITTADAKEVIEREALTSRKTLHPDLYSRSPKPPRIEVAKEKTVFDDGTQRVELYQVGPTQHVAQILVAYFPKQKTLHVADLWDIYAPEQAIAGNDGALLARKVQELGLEVDRLVPVHGVPANGDNLRHGLAIRAKYMPAGTN